MTEGLSLFLAGPLQPALGRDSLPVSRNARTQCFAWPVPSWNTALSHVCDLGSSLLSQLRSRLILARLITLPAKYLHKSMVEL